MFPKKNIQLLEIKNNYKIKKYYVYLVSHIAIYLENTCKNYQVIMY